MSVGIKETLELLDGIKLVAVAAASALKDGLQMADLKVVWDLMEQSAKLKEAVSGDAQIPAELKNLDPLEIEQIASKAFEIANAVKDALLPPVSAA